MVSRALLTPVGRVHDRAKVMAVACLAVVCNDLMSARRWAVRAFEIERERREKR